MMYMRRNYENWKTFVIYHSHCHNPLGHADRLTVAHVLNETHPYHLAWTEVAKLVEERTDGAMRIEVFANGVLGNERDIIEGMQL